MKATEYRGYSIRQQQRFGPLPLLNQLHTKRRVRRSRHASEHGHSRRRSVDVLSIRNLEHLHSAAKNGDRETPLIFVAPEQRRPLCE
jgi:hypothetical protein